MVKKMLKQYDTLVQEVLEDIFEITRSDDKKLNTIIKEYFLNGGKRVRVLLLLICSNLGDFEKNKKTLIIIHRGHEHSARLNNYKNSKHS